MPQGNVSSGLYDLPAEVSDEDSSPGLWEMTVGGNWLPTDVYVAPNPPIFRTETQQIDLLRIAMIVIGVFIGAKILR